MPQQLSANELVESIAQLRARIDALIARGTTPDILAATHADWTLIDQDVKKLCEAINATQAPIAHSVLDDVREMIEMLNFTPLPTGEGGTHER